VVTPLMAKAIVIVGIISIVLLISYDIILEEGMFGIEEEHIVTIQGKDREFYFDSGCWNQWFTDIDGNIYNTDLEIYNKIQPGLTYYIKTGKQSLLNGRRHAHYVEEGPLMSNNFS
jgi:hypothetical protein